MPTSDLATVIDAYALDLASLGLGQKATWKYLDPPSVRPDHCPLLAVFVRRQDFDVIATEDNYESGDLIVVAWFEDATVQLETGGVGSQAAASAALSKMETILSRLRTYATAVPGLADQSEADVVTSRYGLVAGSMWACEIETRVRRWPTSG